MLMLTAKDGEYDQTDAFDLGADDYLTKPFSFVILVARLRALIRRGAPERPVVLTVGYPVLDPARRSVQRGRDRRSPLTAREYGLLQYLMRRHAGDRVARQRSSTTSGTPAFEGGDNVVEVYIGYLRRKIDVPFGVRSLATVRGMGYLLSSDQTSRAGADAPLRRGSRQATGPVPGRAIRTGTRPRGYRWHGWSDGRPRCPPAIARPARCHRLRGTGSHPAGRSARRSGRGPPPGWDRRRCRR